MAEGIDSPATARDVYLMTSALMALFFLTLYTVSESTNNKYLYFGFGVVMAIIYSFLMHYKEKKSK